MTVNEMIDELTQFAQKGHGDKPLVIEQPDNGGELDLIDISSVKLNHSGYSVVIS